MDENVRANITQSTEEAMALLRKTRARLITTGRALAKGMLLSGQYPDGITGQEVFSRMEALQVPGLNSVKAHWLAAIFRSHEFTTDSALHAGLGHDDISHRWTLR